MVELKVELRKGKKRQTVRYKSIREAADKTGIPYQTLYQRLHHGWKLSEAIKTPVREYRNAA